MAEAPDVVALFVAGAHAIVEAIADPSVAEAWDRPSVLEDQLVSGVAGHLARGGVRVVADYLRAGHPAGPVDVNSAASTPHEGAVKFFHDLKALEDAH